MGVFSTFKKLRGRSRGFLNLAAYVCHRLIVYPAAWSNRRLAFATTVVGITGSAGKTTTKDICSAVLSEFGGCPTLRSKNDHFDVVRNLLKLRWSHRYFVVEMSGGVPGHLDHSMSVVKPEIGVLTNIGRDHYKAFLSIEGIAAEKAKIVSRLPKEGTAVLNIDDPNVRTIGEAWPYRKVWVGRSPEATIRLIDASSKWPAPLSLTIEYKSVIYEIKTNLYGTHMALPVLCALGVAAALELPLEKAISGVRKVRPPEGRMQIVEDDDGVVFIRDDWKAPDWTLQAPLEFLEQADAERKVAVIGTVSDFSTDSSSKYKQIAKRARQSADLVIFIGPNAHRAMRARRDPGDRSLLGFERVVDAARFLKQELRRGDLVLLKGSAKADHLVRLIYDRSQPVECWAERCGLNRFCGTCPRLYQSAPMEPKNQPELINRTTAFESSWGNPNGKTTVVVGLGNPGAQYEETPHNIGHTVLDMLANRMGISWQECSGGLMCRGLSEEGKPILLFKPATRMNVSGASVRTFLQEQNGHPLSCIIVHDEMDLAIGDARLKFDGSAVGHKGVKSVLLALETHEVPRLRVGVRAEGDIGKAKQSVLVPFSADERLLLEKGMSKSIELITRAIEKVGVRNDAHIHAASRME